MKPDGGAQKQQAEPKAGTPQEPVAAVEQRGGSLFTHVPHPQIALRELEGPVTRKELMNWGSPVSRFNSRLALLITFAVGSMWCAYLFSLLALVSFPSAIATHDKIIIVAWIAQTFLQLVLLPVIIVGQNLQGKASDKRAIQTYKDAEAILHEALQIQQHLSAQDIALKAQEQRLQQIVADLQKAYPAAAGGAAPSGAE